MERILKIKNLKGVILETYGAGNAPDDERFIKLLDDAIDQGIHIVNVTQCSGGSVLMGHYQTSSQLKKNWGDRCKRHDNRVCSGKIDVFIRDWT